MEIYTFPQGVSNVDFRKVETEMIAQDPKYFIDPIEILESK
jgi:hypothetical protein